ncbi:uncharacterized protein LOC126723245 [Quercus robur]|uniref:uncharacterized protein LOC126723245 n=1 Tax=Quercus robur TaxID=38942 RepID=UPI0021629ED7|nr:uncharacterized protein LOC126723245 [Quercus robur]
MTILIPEGIRNVWDAWNIRGFILISLFLQVFLLFTASLRKKTGNKVVTFFIWSAYLLADWTANFAIGLVFNSEGKYTSGPAPVDDTGLLMVLWTPFLLLLVGGQDRITSFAIEDNELWLRHLLWLILQFFTTSFVFIQSLHRNKLWIPTLFLLVAGTIKYVERTAALYLASLDSFGKSVLGKPEPGPNYERLSSVYSDYQKNKLPVEFESVLVQERTVIQEEELDNLGLVQYAYHFTSMYKGLIVNLMFSTREHKESREFFIGRTAEETLRILEIELNFFYDLLHTKVVVTRSKLGKISQCMSFGLVVAALSLFHKEEKQDLKRFDIKLTYALFMGVLGLDMVTQLLWMFSDWTVAYHKKSNKNSPLGRFLSKIFDKFLDLKKSRWKQSERSTREQPERTTPIIFKRWSQTLSQFSFTKYCWQERSKAMYKVQSRNMITGIHAICYNVYGILKNMHIRGFINQKKNDVIRLSYMFSLPFPQNVWSFIFIELKAKAYSADGPEEAKRISSARGDWVLKNGAYSHLIPYVKDVTYDESILLWHIATDLCYNTGVEPFNYCHREISKHLSDYMIHLLYQQSSLVSEVLGISKQRFVDTCAEAQRFFSQRGMENMEDAYRSILDVNTPLKPVLVKGSKSKSVLFHASMLAKEIHLLGPLKWYVTSQVWVELLSYAASRSRAYAHVQHLSRGGELLTFVWLLMAHLGLRDAWVETSIKTELTVNK